MNSLQVFHCLPLRLSTAPPTPRRLKIPTIFSFRPPPSVPCSSSSSSYAPDEVPIDEEFLKKYAPKEKESEDEARRRNWIERGWAPWEEILTPEADFARKSLNEGEEVPLRSPEAIEAFKMLTPSYRRKKMEESGLSEEEYNAQQFAIKGEIPDPIETYWAGGVLAVRAVPPRDWPPRDWEVDAEELEFIREAHKLEAKRVDLEGEIRNDVESMCVDRYKLFLKQYKEWVAANRDRLEEESYKKSCFLIQTGACIYLFAGSTFVTQFDQDYYPGRRKRGKDYKDDMAGPRIADTDRDCRRPPIPRKRPPIKMEDQPLISDHPYVDKLWQLHVAEQMVLDDEDANPEKYKDKKFIDDTPFDEKNSVQYTKAYYEDALLPKMILAMQLNRKLKKQAEERGEEFGQLKLRRNYEMDEYDLTHWRRSLEEREALIRDIITNTLLYLLSSRGLPDGHVAAALPSFSIWCFLTLGEPLSCRSCTVSMPSKCCKKLNGMAYLPQVCLGAPPLFIVSVETDTLSLLNCLGCHLVVRKALGLPLEEPGRYDVNTAFWKGQYDPKNPRYRYDYWGEPKNSENSRLERMTEDHNKSIVGKGTVWYEMSYEEAIKQRKQREARMKNMPKEDEEQEQDDEDDLDFDYSILGNSGSSSADKPLVNGTESPGISEEGMFEK
ncbi:hypothetical protein AXF42_Ash016119 [Apostasia shenzhenica]|uniref:Protein PLASTID TRANSCRIPTIONALLY ACTIVE 10 n=1 Tax=Apostasia shenzhenica TaxID=1088818 RepID=A0A2I0B3G0_9ASPA|nr:hypothetical protein AXF42_Ash016119 [Apostasia shenzhenica]